MKTKLIFTLLTTAVIFSACVSKKKFNELASENDVNMKKIRECDIELEKLKNELELRKEQIQDYKEDKSNQIEQVGNLTILSKQANENISMTLEQLEKKEKYIQLLQAAKSKTDSINLALAVNLKSELKEGLEDEDVDIQIEKTVVFINLSDKMLYKSGSHDLTPRAKEILGKIAKIIDGQKDLEVMVESYTDNKPISNSCIKDNWDLSVKRSTSVVRALQSEFKVDPNRLIAAGRGEFNAKATNETAEGRSQNRRTRIIIMPKLDQFYDLLAPKNMPK